MQIKRGTDTAYEVVQNRKVLLKSDSFEECQKYLAKNTPGLTYIPKYQACLTQPELNRRSGRNASTTKTKEIA